MRKIITFLGKYPKETQYQVDQEVYTGSVFAEALLQFETFDEMLVLTTKEAHHDSWPVLAAHNNPKIREISIPTGISSSEIWGIFDCIIDEVDRNDTVIFDITHGLRSIPFLVFLFASFLKSAKNVTIGAIYYGAFELGDAKNNVPAPVFDLSEFAKMLDWITATDQFVETGSAQKLSNLMVERGQKNPASQKAAATLQKISKAAALCQPFALFEATKSLEKDLEKAETEFSNTSQPFRVLKQQMLESLQNFMLPEESEYSEDLEKVKAEYRLIEWYISKDQLMQVATLTREWTIDVFALQLGLPLDFKRAERRPVEDAVSGIAMLGQPRKDHDTGETYTFSTKDLNEYGRRAVSEWAAEQISIFTDLWNNLYEVRNTLAHAGHQSSALRLSKIESKFTRIINNIRELADQYNLIF